MGVQVVGRAFARALRQEFAGKPLSVYVWEPLSSLDFPCVVSVVNEGISLGRVLWLGWPGALSHGRRQCQTLRDPCVQEKFH